MAQAKITKESFSFIEREDSEVYSLNIKSGVSIYLAYFSNNLERSKTELYNSELN